MSCLVSYLAGPCASFHELKRWLEEFPNQMRGTPQAICETGEHYVEFFGAALARPDDVGVIEGVVARAVSKQLESYFETRGGRLYFRVPFESAVTDTFVVERYDENGPDYDPLIGRKCVADKNWKYVRAYVRLYRASHAFGEPLTLVKSDETAASA